MSVRTEDVCVCYCLDVAFLIPTFVSFRSVLKHLPCDSNISFLFIHEGLKKAEIAWFFIAAMKHPKIKIEFKPPKKISANALITQKLSRATYYRLFLHEQTTKKRVVYLDGDTLITKDITMLALTDLQSQPVAGVNSPGAARNRVINCPKDSTKELFLDYLKRLGANDTIEFGYINAGVLVIDAEHGERKMWQKLFCV